MERKTYTKEQIRELAKALKVGGVHFQFNVSQNSERIFEVGYVWPNGINKERHLFAKSPNSYRDFEKADNRDVSEDRFYLCNEYEERAERM